MPDKATIARARRDAREGKSASTQAGEFVRAEMERIRRGEHGARNAKQAIAIGLSEARRAGVKLPAGKNATATTRRKAKQDMKHAHQPPSPKRSRARIKALKKEPRSAASHRALSRQARQAARRRGAAARSRSARRAAHTRQSRRR